MKLITEYISDTQAVLEESTSGQKNWFFEGVFMQSEVKNRNGRVYPKRILEVEVDRYNREYVLTKRAIGELNHPRSPIVDPERASHLITEIKQNGNDFVGRAKVLNTPMGNIVKGLLESGVNIGVSSRGMGSLKENGGVMEVQDDFRLACIDVVADPSAPSAFVNGILEGVEWAWSNGNFVQEKIIEEIVTDIHSMKDAKTLAETEIKAFTKFMDAITKVK